MQEKKRKRSWILAAIILTICIPRGTMAFFTGMEQVDNCFVIGENRSAVDENFVPPDNLDKDVEHRVEKGIRVKNEQTVPCYIRIRIMEEREGVNCKWEMEDVANWEKHGDYYYYKLAVEPGTYTSYLTKAVTLKNMDKDARPFSIYVYEESIQTFEPESERYLDWKQAWKYYAGTEGGVVF